MTFYSNSVTESLCCPSRVSILRSQYVHNHQVLSNMMETGGGYGKFKALGEDKDCLPTWLQASGVTTGIVGKYLNQFPGAGNPNEIPPGWDYFSAPITPSRAYEGYDYTLNTNGVLTGYGHKPKDFLNTVMTRQAVQFIQKTQGPFYLQVNSYLPHSPAPVDPKHAGDHAGDPLPAAPSLNTQILNAPPWMVKAGHIGKTGIRKLREYWNQRLDSAESLADTITTVQRTVKASGHAYDTYIIITSDNGFHMGSHQLFKGKRTAYDTDTLVPLVIIGPDAKPGVRVDALTSTIDFAPTISELMKSPYPSWVDGRSLTPFLHNGTAPLNWRESILSEVLIHSSPGDPDFTKEEPPPFTSIRTDRWLYVRYDDSSLELYDRLKDPYQLRNIAAYAPGSVLRRLDLIADLMSDCRGETCHAAERITVPYWAGMKEAPPKGRF
jgi:arylsulfatase A-like enzyme